MADAVPTRLSDRALHLFAVPEEDRAALAATADEVCVDARLADWVAATGETLRASVGRPSPPPPLTSRPPGPPESGAYLLVLALADVLPTTLAWSEAKGIPAPVVAATMRDVGRMLRRNRLWFGRPGIDDELGGWVTRHLIGSIHQVGRLQYERTGEGTLSSAWLRRVGVGIGPGDPVIHLHIPGAGPLTPEAVGESLRAGKAFLRQRFPDERFGSWNCISWLLDPQLAEYLPADSNILRFQSLFRIGPAKDDDGDVSVRKFVFDDTHSIVSDLPQRSSLERAAVAHWKAGRHWKVHLGRLLE